MISIAVYSALQPGPVPELQFIVAPTEADIGPVLLGERNVGFKVTNPSERPRRIIGLKEG